MQEHIKHNVETGERLAAIEAELPYIRKSLIGIERAIENMSDAIQASTEQTQKMIGGIIHTHQGKLEAELNSLEGRMEKKISNSDTNIKEITERLIELEGDKKAVTWVGNLIYFLFGAAVIGAIGKWING